MKELKNYPEINWKWKEGKPLNNASEKNIRQHLNK